MNARRLQLIQKLLESDEFAGIREDLRIELADRCLTKIAQNKAMRRLELFFFVCLCLAGPIGFWIGYNFSAGVWGGLALSAVLIMGLSFMFAWLGNALGKRLRQDFVAEQEQNSGICEGLCVKNRGSETE